ncbi:MAG: glycosyltransferase family 39 protein [Candidatus Woesearchaeota archaeon]
MKKKTSFFLLGIIIISLLISVPFLNEESFWGDEYHSIFTANKELSKLLDHLVNKDNHAPLYFIILHFWIKFFGITEVSTRMLSTIFGVFAIIMCYLLSRQIFDKKTAKISSIIFLTSGIFQTYMQEVRMYTLVTFLVLSQIYFFSRYLRKNKKIDLFFYSIFTVLSLYTHPFASISFILINIFAVAIHKKVTSQWLFAQMIILLLYSYWIKVILSQFIAHYDTIMMLIESRFGSIINFEIILSLTSIFFILFCHYLYRNSLIVIKKIKRIFYSLSPGLLLAAILVVETLQIFFYNMFFSSSPFIRYFLFLLPLTIMVVSYKIATIKSKNMALIILASILIFQIGTVAFNLSNTNRYDWKNAVKEVRPLIKEEDYAIGFDSGGTSFDLFNYYYKKTYNEDIKKNMFRVREDRGIISDIEEEYVSADEFYEIKKKTKIVVITNRKEGESQIKKLLDEKSPFFAKKLKDIEIYAYN